MLKKRWWCDWYLSPSEGEYFREDEIYFFRLIILIPFLSMLLSWPWFDHLTLFPYWFNTLATLILTFVCMDLSTQRRQSCSLIDWFVMLLLSSEWCWHGFMFCIEISTGLNITSENVEMLGYPYCILSKWAEPLWWALLRDGAYFIIVIYRIISLYNPHLPCPSIPDELFDEDQLFNLAFRSNYLGRRRRRRSSVVIHYILLRRGHIRRRNRKKFFQKKPWLNQI